MNRLTVRDFSLALAVLAVGLVFTWLSPAFIGPRNLSNLAVELAITAILALGMFLVILPGQIDLAAGSGAGLFGGLAAVFVFHHHWPAPLALAVSAMLSMAVWAAMGALIVRQRIPAFITTLAGLLVFQGLHWLVINNATVPVKTGGENLYSLLTTWYLPPAASFILVIGIIMALAITTTRARLRRQRYILPVEERDLAVAKLIVVAQLLILAVVVVNQYRGIPLAALVLGVLAVAAQVVTRHTRFGRHLYAIGGNSEAAALSGIAVGPATIAAFAAAGAIVAITGFMQTAYAGASTTTVGQHMELDAIAACVIGGTSLRGGRGNVAGVLFGALIMATLLNGMTLLATPPEIKLIVRGSVLALAVWLDVKLGRERA